jgi:hypothetical protein
MPAASSAPHIQAVLTCGYPDVIWSTALSVFDVRSAA